MRYGDSVSLSRIRNPRQTPVVDLPNGKNNASMSLPSDCPSTNLEQAPAAILVLSVVVADFAVLADYWW